MVVGRGPVNLQKFQVVPELYIRNLPESEVIHVSISCRGGVCGWQGSRNPTKLSGRSGTSDS